MFPATVLSPAVVVVVVVVVVCRYIGMMVLRRLRAQGTVARSPTDGPGDLNPPLGQEEEEEENYQ